MTYADMWRAAVRLYPDLPRAVKLAAILAVIAIATQVGMRIQDELAVTYVRCGDMWQLVCSDPDAFVRWYYPKD